MGSHLEMAFRPVPVGERHTNSKCISCIYWVEKAECYVTSADAIYMEENRGAEDNPVAPALQHVLY